MKAPSDPGLDAIFATGDTAAFRERLRAASARELMLLSVKATRRGYENFRDAAEAECRRRLQAQAATKPGTSHGT